MMQVSDRYKTNFSVTSVLFHRNTLHVERRIEIMIYMYFVFLCVLAGAFGFTQQEANQYIDRVLYDQLHSEISYLGLNPASLGNVSTDVNITFREKSFKARVLLHSGLLYLTIIEREGNCSLPVKISSNVTFTCTLGLKSMRAPYKVLAIFDDVYDSFIIEGYLENTYIQLEVTSSSYYGLNFLTGMDVNKVGDVKGSTSYGENFSESKEIFKKVNDLNSANLISEISKIIKGPFREALRYSIYRTRSHF